MRFIRERLLTSVGALILVFTFVTATWSHVSGQEIGGMGKGVITRQVSAEGTGLLSSFRFSFMKTDHPLKIISVHQDLANVELAFADRDPSDPDDEYFYKVILQRNSNPGIIQQAQELSRLLVQSASKVNPSNHS